MQARANVMIYDDAQKKWIPMGMSKVQIYQHTVNNTFRVVGRKLQDHDVMYYVCLFIRGKIIIFKLISIHMLLYCIGLDKHNF